MNKAQRELALDTIKESGGTRVILISFKAGSTGECPMMSSGHLIDNER